MRAAPPVSEESCCSAFSNSIPCIPGERAVLFRQRKNRRLSELPLRSRIVVYLRRLLLSFAVIALLFRGPVEYRLWRIQSVGGTVHIGPTNTWLYRHLQQMLPATLTSSTSYGRLFWPELVGVDLRGVSDPADAHSAIVAATEFRGLRHVVLYQSGATDDDIQLISTNCRALTFLIANETAITNVGISHLRDCPNLRSLNIQRTAVGDACVDDLLAIPRLKELMVGDTKIQSKAMDRLRAGIRIVREKFVTNTRCKMCRQFLSYCLCTK